MWARVARPLKPHAPGELDHMSELLGRLDDVAALATTASQDDPDTPVLVRLNRFRSQRREIRGNRPLTEAELHLNELDEAPTAFDSNLEEFRTWRKPNWPRSFAGWNYLVVPFRTRLPVQPFERQLQIKSVQD